MRPVAVSTTATSLCRARCRRSVNDKFNDCHCYCCCCCCRCDDDDDDDDDINRDGLMTSPSHQSIGWWLDWLLRSLQYYLYCISVEVSLYSVCYVGVWLISVSQYRPIGRYRRSKHTKSMACLKLVTLNITLNLNFHHCYKQCSVRIWK